MFHDLAGTAVLAAYLILAVLLFYWTVRKFLRSTSSVFTKIGTALLSVFLVAAGAMLLMMTPYAWRGPVYTLNNISLGDTEKDVLFRLGNWNSKCIAKGTSDPAKYTLYFEFDENRLRMLVSINNDAVTRVVYIADAFSMSWPFRNTVRFQETLERLQHDWGESDGYVETGDNERIYLFKRFNLGTLVSRGLVDSVMIFDPEKWYKDNERSNVEMECRDQNGVLTKN